MFLYLLHLMIQDPNSNDEIHIVVSNWSVAPRRPSSHAPPQHLHLRPQVNIPANTAARMYRIWAMIQTM